MYMCLTLVCQITTLTKLNRKNVIDQKNLENKSKHIQMLNKITKLKYSIGKCIMFNLKGKRLQ